MEARVLVACLCVTVFVCGVQAQVASLCRPQERFLMCGCPRTCRDPNPDCKAVCRAGCYCEDNQVRNDDGICVNLSECPPIVSAFKQDTSEPRANGGRCPENEEYRFCEPCPKTCENPNPVCPAQCSRGCFCRDGLLKDEDGKCVEPENCSKSKSMPPIQYHMTCSEHQVYKQCETCEKTCSNPNPKCPMPCAVGCFCEDGYVKSPNGHCVKLDECPKGQRVRNPSSMPVTNNTEQTPIDEELRDPLTRDRFYSKFRHMRVNITDQALKVLNEALRETQNRNRMISKTHLMPVPNITVEAQNLEALWNPPVLNRFISKSRPLPVTNGTNQDLIAEVLPKLRRPLSRNRLIVKFRPTPVVIGKEQSPTTERAISDKEQTTIEAPKEPLGRYRFVSKFRPIPINDTAHASNIDVLKDPRVRNRYVSIFRPKPTETDLPFVSTNDTDTERSPADEALMDSLMAQLFAKFHYTYDTEQAPTDEAEVMVGPMAHDSQEPSIEDCAPDEEYFSCGWCEPSCSNPAPSCPIMVCTRGCLCRPPLLRHHSGHCVEEKDCFPQKCKDPNEEYVCRYGCEPRCEPRVCVRPRRCLLGCHCRLGLLRDSATGLCVPKDECSPNKINTDTNIKNYYFKSDTTHTTSTTTETTAVNVTVATGQGTFDAVLDIVLSKP